MDKHEMANAVAGASGTIEIGGRTWLVAPPTDADARTVSLFIAKHSGDPLAELVESPAWPRLSPEQQDRLIDRAMQDRRESDREIIVTGAQALKVLTSVDGCRFLLWLLLRKSDSTLTREQVGAWVTEENCEAVFADLDQASGMSALGNSAGRPGSEMTPASTGTSSTAT